MHDLAPVLSTVASAISTAILMYAAYHWPAGSHEDDEHERGRHESP